MISDVVLFILGIDLLCVLVVEIYRQIRAFKYTFANKHVLITGGSSGLGLELAKRIAAQKATVTIIARNIEQLKKAKIEIDSYCTEIGLMTPHVFTESADVSNKESISDAVCNAVNKNGEVDIVICNAGMAKTGYRNNYILMIRYAFGQTQDDYQQSININYMGAVNTLFSTVPNMIKRNKVLKKCIIHRIG